MSGYTETHERALVEDLRGMGSALEDERLCRDLYKALASRALSKRGAEGHVALSWNRAAEVVNLARGGQDLPPIDGLANSGGEGELTDRAQHALESIGWISQPENTERHDPRHRTSPEDAPPASRRAADREPPEWERQAHTAADETIARRENPPRP
jgi:hypothetical protein